jgi:hypothetical protein
MIGAFLCDGIRTPIGRYGGALATIKGFRTIFTQSSGINMPLIQNVSFMPDRNSSKYQCVDADA